MKDSLRNFTEWILLALSTVFITAAVVMLLILHVAARTFELPQELYLKHTDRKLLEEHNKERERTEYYHRYL